MLMLESKDSSGKTFDKSLTNAEQLLGLIEESTRTSMVGNSVEVEVRIEWSTCLLSGNTSTISIRFPLSFAVNETRVR